MHGAMQDGLSVFAFSVDIGAVREQILQWRDVVTERRVGQRRGAFEIAVVDVDSVTNGEVDAVDVTARRRMMEDRLADVAATVQIGAVLRVRELEFVDGEPVDECEKKKCLFSKRGVQRFSIHIV